MRRDGKLVLGDCEFDSCLILGTGKFSDRDTMIRAIQASGAQLVTVALRRFNREQAAKLRDEIRRLQQPRGHN